MDVLRTMVRPDSAEFKENQQKQEGLRATLKERLELVAQGGSARSVETHRSRNKMLPRERIEKLTDPGTPFLELSSLATWGMYDNKVPAAGGPLAKDDGSSPAIMHAAPAAVVAGDDHALFCTGTRGGDGGARFGVVRYAGGCCAGSAVRAGSRVAVAAWAASGNHFVLPR